MNFKQLRCFHTVATEGGFTAAARALGLSQPTITDHVKRLEAYFGVELFARDRNHVELTDTGRALLEVTRRIMSLETEAYEVLTAAGGLKGGHLKIASASPYQVTGPIMAFGRDYPAVRLSVSITNSREALAGLFDFTRDVAVIGQMEHDPRIHSVHINRDRLIAFVDASHPWGHRKSIALRDFEGQRVVFRETGSMTRQAFEDALGKSGVEVQNVLEIGSYEAVHEAVLAGIGIGVVLGDEFVPAEGLKPLAIADAEIIIDTHVACLRERRGSPLIRAFFELLGQGPAGSLRARLPGVRGELPGVRR